MTSFAFRADTQVWRGFNSATPRGRGMTTVMATRSNSSSVKLQFGHAQRAWDDIPAWLSEGEYVLRLQFGHAQRAWDDRVPTVASRRQA